MKGSTRTNLRNTAVTAVQYITGATAFVITVKTLSDLESLREKKLKSTGIHAEVEKLKKDAKASATALIDTINTVEKKLDKKIKKANK